MSTIDTITLEVDDVAEAETFYGSVFGLGQGLQVRHSEEATSGFRGYTLSLVVAQPADARLLISDALAAGATELKPAAKSLWGFGGTLRAPGGTVWNIATSSKKDTRPASRDIESVVLLLGVSHVPTSRDFYAARGIAAKRSFGSYVDFDTDGPIGLGLYKRAALAKSAGVDAEGSGSHRIVIGGDLGEVVDPDGFRWQPSGA